MSIKITQVNQIEESDWNSLVEETYGRPYCLQQQDGCKGRGVEYLNVPEAYTDDEFSESIPEIVNGSEMGVQFNVWLARDPNQPLNSKEGSSKYGLECWWERNFYPHVNAVANDLHKRGLLPAGEYQINIDW